MDQQETLNKIYNWLVFQKEMGNRFIKASESIRRFLETQMNNFSTHTFHSLKELRDAALSCKKCHLHETRTSVVFGEGPEDAKVFIVGEAPGKEEDIQGRPFVGPSGELLTRMLQAIDLERSKVYITSVLKCRPPKNRTPNPDEVSACSQFLTEQIRFIDPPFILALGKVAAHALLGTRLPIKKLMGKPHPLENRQVIVTYHPAYLLRFGGERQKALKKEAWLDLQILQKLYKEI